MSGDPRVITIHAVIDATITLPPRGPEPPPPDTFQLGVTEPTAELTYTPDAICGPRVPQRSMANYAGSFTNVADGEQIDRLVITGAFEPEASGWALRDSLILGGPPTDTIYPLIDVRDGAITTGLIEFVEVAPTYNGFEVYGFKGGNVHLHRSILRGVVDGAQPHGSGTYPNTNNKAVSITGTLIEVLHTTADPGQSDGITHNDGIQSAGGLTTLAIIGNAIHGGRTSCVLLQQNQGTFGVVLIDRNWFYGDPDEGASFNTSQNGRGVIAADGALIVTGNRIARAGHAPHMLMSGSTLDAPTTHVAGNVFDDGTPCPMSRGAD